jgi:hypothetical protein
LRRLARLAGGVHHAFELLFRWKARHREGGEPQYCQQSSSTSAVSESHSPTAFANISRRAARLILAGTLVAIVVCVGFTLSPHASSNLKPERGQPGDVDLYQAVVERVGAGEGYYGVLGDELRGRGYPTASVFNWRTPLPLWVIGKLPHPMFGKVLLCALALAVLLGAFELVGREGGTPRAMICGLALVGALMPVLLTNLYVMPSLWAGVLIALSLVSYGLGRRRTAIALGMAAWLVRDLAGLYCVASLAIAVWKKQWKEALAWTACVAAYAAFFAVHAVQVAAMSQPGDVAHAEGWLQFGGLPFVIATTQMNAFLLVLPQWTAAIYLPICLVGFAGWNTPAGRRVALVVVAYLGAFACVGQMFNQYWGCLFAPAMCLGFAFAPAAIHELWTASGWKMPSWLARQKNHATAS